MEHLTIKLQSDGDTPLYAQLYAFLIREMEAGRLREGERLPSKRALCAHLGVSQSTVETAYGMLAAEGYIRAVAKSGYFANAVLRAKCQKRVDKPEEPEAAAPPEFDFSTGAVDTSIFPYASWAKLSREVISCNPQLLQRGLAQGDRSLRQALTVFLREYRGVRCTAGQIVVGAGMEYLLDMLVQLLPRETVYALEDPGYGAFYRVLQRHGRQSRPIPLDEGGMRDDLLRGSDAQVAYVTPSHQFPMGVTMPIGRRSRLLAWAEEAPERYLIEDDYDSEFRYASRPIPAMQGLDQNQRVIYVGTFSRSVAPSIRVAYLVLPEGLLQRYHRQFDVSASTVSRFEQQTLCAFLEQGLYSRHLRRSANLYRKKQQLLLSRLEEIPGASASGADAGLHFLLTVAGRDEDWLLRRAAQRGVVLQGLSSYCRRCPCPPSTLVLGFAGLQTQQIPQAADLLIQAFTEEA